MLAARTAWTILRGEHSQIRRFLASIAEVLLVVQWNKPGSEVARLRHLIESLQSFDMTSHRPKGVALMDALRGRSPDADRLLDMLEQERESDDALLLQALGMLNDAARANASAGVECAAILARHRERVLHHLDQEDTLLFAHTGQLLTEEEWSRVVSAISSRLHSPGRGSR